MDSVAETQINRRVWQEVKTMLTEGDRTYLENLSFSALLEVVENELRFLGLYAHEDIETPAVIHRILEKNLDTWCEEYLWAPKVEIDSSPYIQESQSLGFEFIFIIERSNFDFGY